MSQMRSSTSHQLVTAAFRRARRKFPKNFGQCSWPMPLEQKDCKKQSEHSKVPAKTCNSCQERFARQSIRNVRSNNVWPQFTSSWTTDPRCTRSMREANTSLSCEERGVTRYVSGCACRRYCRSSKRNIVVSFDEGGKLNNRCSGGDGAEGKSSIETSSSKSYRSCLQDDENLDDGNKSIRITNEEKLNSQHHLCCHENVRESQNDFVTNDQLDLLYDRNRKSENSVPFLCTRRERDANSCSGEQDRRLDFPKKLHEWEMMARENSMEPYLEARRPIVGEEDNLRCLCGRKKYQALNERRREFRHRTCSNCHRLVRHKSSFSPDLLLKSEVPRDSCFKDTKRLCNQCALGQCSRNSGFDASLPEDAEDEEEEDTRFRIGDACAIKHKDSVAILVEKFKNKKVTNSSKGETIFNSDEDSLGITHESNENKKNKRDDAGKERASESEDKTNSYCCKHENNLTNSKEITSKFHNRSNKKKIESQITRSGCRCPSNSSCHQSL